MLSFVSYFLEYNRYCNVLGIFAVLAIAYLFSKNRRAVSGRLIINALVAQCLIAYTILRTSIGQAVIQKVAFFVGKLYSFADEGSRFVFGGLVDASGPWGFVFAIKVLPIIIFFGALMAILFHYGIVQWTVSLVSKGVRPLLGTTGPETLCAIANSFLGQTEAPLLIRNYLHSLSNSEMLVVMISGMGTISGSILAVFAAMGIPAVHLLTASVMAIPGTVMIAKILYPNEGEEDSRQESVASQEVTRTSNVLEAISIGTSDGLQLALNVAAMLVAFISLIALVNYLLGSFSSGINSIFAWHIPTLSLNVIFGWIFAPFGYLLGFTGKEALIAGELIGIKVTINEMVAYGTLVGLNMSERFVDIITYALCGFSNFSCIGIQIGGIGALVPGKRTLLSKLGLYAVLGGALSNLLSAMIVGLIL